MLGRLLAISVLAAVASCEGSAAPEGGGLTIEVAPIDYPGLDKVVYDLAVYTRVGDGYQQVWHEEDVDSVRFGDGVGAITFIGACDAQGQDDGWTPGCAGDGACGCVDDDDCDAAGEKRGWVVIDIDSLWADGDTLDDAEWVNPCPAFGFGATADPTTAGCVLTFRCEENADVAVEFNLTVMRDADQGFFDVMVEFEDIFCSAKFDTCYRDDGVQRRIQALFRGGERWDTGVLAIACSGGVGANTHLYLDDVVLDCDAAGPIHLDPSQALAGNVVAPDGQGVVFGYATYRGREDLRCLGAQGASASCAKVYWSVAIGFDTDEAHALGDDCTLVTTATASDGELDGAWVTPPKNRYPVIRFEIPLADGDLLACGHWGVDETPGELVYTTYTSFECGLDESGELAGGAVEDCDFCHQFDGVAAEGSGRPECAGVVAGPTCGDGTCAPNETAQSCPVDCHCGDGTCAPNETAQSCPVDCHCGDGTCAPNETAQSCPVDCHCGDGTCAPTLGETAATCALDCHCGDLVCQGGETLANCPQDCFAPGGDLALYCQCSIAGATTETFAGCSNDCSDPSRAATYCTAACQGVGGTWGAGGLAADCRGAQQICMRR